MKRQFRLTSSSDFERVRQTGKSFPHPLVVLVAAKNDSQQLRVGIAAGRSVGGAVQRNRAKRLLRASIHTLLPTLQPGWDVIFLARRGLIAAGYWNTKSAVEQVLRKAGLFYSEVNRDER